MFRPIDLPPLYEPVLDDLSAAFKGFIKKGEYIGGEYVQRFEDLVKNDLGANFVISCKSGTHALQLALLSAGVEAGDEVITVANTYYATAYAIKSIGAIPVFCEINEKNGLIDHDKLTDYITAKTKAVIPVHLYGISADTDQLESICGSKGLTLIEDCSHAYGSRYKASYVGQHSEYACFSLYPTKNLGAFGDAGMIATKSEEVASRIRALLYLADNTKTRFDPLAIHARLDSIQACLLSVVMERLIHKFNSRRAELRDYYVEALSRQPSVRLLSANWNSVIPYVFPVYVEDRHSLMSFLKENKNFHFPIHYSTNLHCLEQFGGKKAETLPLTQRHNNTVVTFPLTPAMSVGDVEKVCEAVKEFYQK